MVAVHINRTTTRFRKVLYSLEDNTREWLKDSLVEMGDKPLELEEETARACNKCTMPQAGTSRRNSRDDKLRDTQGVKAENGEPSRIRERRRLEEVKGYAKIHVYGHIH